MLVVWSALGSATFTFIMQCPSYHLPPALTLFMQSAGGGVATGDISIISSHGSADCCWTAGSTPHPSVCPHVRGDTALDTRLPSGLYTGTGQCSSVVESGRDMLGVANPGAAHSTLYIVWTAVEIHTFQLMLQLHDDGLHFLP